MHLQETTPQVYRPQITQMERIPGSRHHESQSARSRREEMNQVSVSAADRFCNLRQSASSDLRRDVRYDHSVAHEQGWKRDSAYFARKTLDLICGTVVWPNGADLAPDALHDLEDEVMSESTTRPFVHSSLQS